MEVASTKISTKTDKDSFFACGVQVKIRAKNSIAFYSFALCAAKVPLGLCSRISLQQRNFFCK